MANPIEISAIIPVTERPEDRPDSAADVLALAKEYLSVLETTGSQFEIIYVVDGDKPKIFELLLEYASEDKRLRILKFSKSFGDATAISAGFSHSSGKVIVTLPAWRQVEPGSILNLLAALDECDMATGYRKNVVEAGRSGLRRKAFHRLSRFLSGEDFHDLGCAARAFDRQLLEEISLYGSQHIFLPLLASRLGFRVAEVRLLQATNAAASESNRISFYLKRGLDLLTVVFLVRFTKKPVRFFGMVGSITFIFGAVVLALLIAQRLIFGVPLADRPALLLASLLTVLGLQIFALGLLGELIIFTHATDMKEYTIEKIVN